MNTIFNFDSPEKENLIAEYTRQGKTIDPEATFTEHISKIYWAGSVKGFKYWDEVYYKYLTKENIPFYNKYLIN